MPKVGIEKNRKPNMFMMIMLVAVLATAAFAVTSLQEQSADAADSSVMYKDKDGNTLYADDPIVLNTTYLTSVGYELGSGWYVVYGYTTFGKQIVIAGDVNIILSGEMGVATNGINIQSGASLTLYGQGGSMDKLSSSNTLIVMNGGSLINNASIQCSSSNRTMITVAGGSDNTIHNYGTISTAQGNSKVIVSAVDLTVHNHKEIRAGGANSYALYVEGKLTLINYSKGEVNTTGSMATIIYAESGDLKNYGTIRGTGSNTDAVVFDYYAIIYNYAGGLIRGSDDAVLMNGGGEVYNSGTIGDVYMPGYGVYMNGGTVINNAGGMILGSHAVTFYDDGVLFNAGQVGGMSIGVEALGDAAVTLTNKNLISGGVILHDVTNHVTFSAGSRIYGDFIIGLDPASTLSFIGTPGTNLTYATIDGNVKIGTNLVFVELDVDALPPTLVTGNKLILISAYGFTGTPLNNKILDGGYDFSLSVESSKRLVAVLVGLPSYGITLSEDEHTFPNAIKGYGPQPTIDVIVTNIGTVPTGALSITVIGADPGGVDLDIVFISNISATAGSNTAVFKIGPHIGLAPGTYTATVVVSTADGNNNPIASVSMDLYFTVEPAPVGHHEYYITALADSGSTISPMGTVVVQPGGKVTFKFSALPGREISAVVVDGKPLTYDKVKLGYYTFSDVHSNHTIQVWSTDEELVLLTIEVIEGEGHTTFSVNGGQPQMYVSPVPIPKRAHLTVQAYGDDGYVFKEWRVDMSALAAIEDLDNLIGSYGEWTGGVISYKAPQISFSELTESLHLDVYFGKEKSGFPWWVVLIGLLGFLFLFFIIFYRRRYNVYIPEGSAIVGKDSVWRKKAYVFTVDGGYTGAVLYRVKEDGEWKQVFKNAEGEFVIPKDEVVGDIYLQGPAQ